VHEHAALQSRISSGIESPAHVALHAPSPQRTRAPAQGEPAPHWMAQPPLPQRKSMSPQASVPSLQTSVQG
jgi:hypothetical protein